MFGIEIVILAINTIALFLDIFFSAYAEKKKKPYNKYVSLGLRIIVFLGIISFIILKIYLHKWFAVVSNVIFLVFWIFVITSDILKELEKKNEERRLKEIQKYFEDKGIYMDISQISEIGTFGTFIMIIGLESDNKQ